MANTARLTGLYAATGTGAARLTGVWGYTLVDRSARLTGLYATVGSPLTITVGANFVADAFDTVQLVAASTELGMPAPAGYVWTQTAGPAVTATGSTTNVANDTVTFVTPASVDGTTVTFRAVADGGPQASVTITCRAWPGPWRTEGGVWKASAIGGPRPLVA